MGGQKLQYFITLNEEGTLIENFGEADKIYIKKLLDEAVLIFTPTKKLFGDF